MGRRARLTIACVLRDRALRVDCDRDGPRGEPDVIEPPPTDAASALRALLTIRPAAPRVLVLLDGAWTQTIDLAAAAIAGLDVADVRRAIAHELEPVSGIPAANARIAVREIDAAASGRRSFWVVQMRSEAAADLEREVAAAGAHLAGISTVCGLGLANGIAIDDLRVEAWEHATFCGSLAEPERVVAGRTGRRYWTQAIEEWAARHTRDVVHWAGSSRPLPATNEALHDLGPLPAVQDSAHAGAWLVAIAPLLQDQHGELLPLVGPAPRVRRERPLLVALVLALAVAVFAWFDDCANHRELVATQARLDDVRLRKQQREQQAKSDADLARRLQEIMDTNDAEAARIEDVEVLWQRERSMIPKLLEKVAAVRPRGILLRSLRTGVNGATEVTGIGTDTKVVDDFTAELAAALRDHGWDVTPAHSSEQTVEGRTYQEFVTSLLAVTSSAVMSSPKPRRRSS